LFHVATGALVQSGGNPPPSPVAASEPAASEGLSAEASMGEPDSPLLVPELVPELPEAPELPPLLDEPELLPVLPLFAEPELFVDPELLPDPEPLDEPLPLPEPLDWLLFALPVEHPAMRTAAEAAAISVLALLRTKVQTIEVLPLQCG